MSRIAVFGAGSWGTAFSLVLADAGHEVTLWTSAFDHIRKQWRTEWQESDNGVWTAPDGLEVRFMKGCGYYRNVGPRRLADHMLAARDFERQAATLRQPDIAIASLPDHITAAAMVERGRRGGFPVIIDVRDKWPDILFDLAPSPAKPFVRLGLFHESRRARRALRDTDGLVAMMQSMLDWGLRKSGRPANTEDRIFFLATTEANTAESAPASNLSAEHRALINTHAQRMIFTFVGTFNRTQHPSLVLDALDILAARPDFDTSALAVLIGGDGVDADAVRGRISALPFAHDLGWLKPIEMNAILARSDVGLLPMNFPSEAFNNKAFAYLASGLPILNGALGDLADLIDREQVGINVNAGDPGALADAIAYCVDNPDNVSTMKSRTRALYDRAFDQQQIYTDYVRHVEKVARASAKR